MLDRFYFRCWNVFTSDVGTFLLPMLDRYKFATKQPEYTTDE